VTTPIDRAASRYAAGVAASTDGHPIVAGRQFRAALRHLNGRRSAHPAGRAAAELRGRILTSLAWVEAEQGRVGHGFRLLDEAEPLIPARLRGILHGQRGLLLQRDGRDNLAVGEYDAAIGLLSEQPVDLVKVLSNRGSLHLRAGRLRLARADLRRSAQLAGRHGMTLLAAIVTHNLGDLELLAGDLPAALSTFAGVADVYEDLAPGRLADLAIDRARALLAAGLFAEADRELRVALEQARTRRLSYTYERALLARAEAALVAGHPASARAWAVEARSRQRRRHNVRHAALAELLALRARFATTAAPALIAGRARALAKQLDGLGLTEDGRVAGMLAARALIACRRVAEAEAELAGHRRPRGSDRLDTRLLRRLTQAELATAAGRAADAARHLRAGMISLQRYRSQLGCLDLQTGAAVHGRDLAATGVSAAVASGSSADVYRWSELARAQALLLPPVRPPADARAAATLEELRQVRGMLREAELSGTPTGALRRRSETLQRVLRERAWSAAGPGTATTPAPMRAVLAELAGSAMVAYLRDSAVLWALVMVDGSAALVRLGLLADAEEALLRLRADLDAQAGRVMRSRLAGAVAEATRQDAAALAAAVLDPVLDLIGDRDLVVVPTGALMTVPWAVLPGCAQRPVTVALSATTWLVARRRRDRRESAAAPARTLLVAGPGNERGEAEVRAIAATHAHATVLTGSAATPAATLARLGDVRTAHLAAHGHHAADNPLFSALDLADGPLMGYDLQHADGTPGTVVLSSCDLGLTNVRPGDETLGMITTLLSAGSSTVVASVGRVADETAMTVMVDYHLATGRGLSPAVALAGAMKPAHPASFVCFGNG
jgi:tetratricopeptide (TPR) repeat protein